MCKVCTFLSYLLIKNLRCYPTTEDSSAVVAKIATTGEHVNLLNLPNKLFPNHLKTLCPKEVQSFPRTLDDHELIIGREAFWIQETLSVVVGSRNHLS